MKATRRPLIIRNNTPEEHDFLGFEGASTESDCPVSVLRAWNPTLRATMAADDEDNTVSIFDPIGESFFFNGVTVKRIDAALRSIGRSKDVVVNINSPGGSMFEGIAIYNRLRQHRGAIRVNIIGLAASSASVIAMAGDEIVMNRGAQIMIHNPMAGIVGDHRALDEAAATLRGFRDSIIDIYMSKSNLDAKALSKMLDAETWMNDKTALKNGFATGIEDMATETGAAPTNQSSRATAMEVLKVTLAKEGFTRKERAELFRQLGIAASVTDDPPAESVTGDPEGVREVLAALKNLQETMEN